jgi:hypothetical protein
MKQLAEYGVAVPVVAGYQSNKEGRENQFIMFFPVDESAHGWQGRSYSPNTDHAHHVERQIVEKTIQLQGFSDEQGDHTALDLTSLARMVVNSLPFVEAMRKSGVGVQRAGTIRTPFFINDHGDYEMNPSFDFKITHNRFINPITPVVHTLIQEIKQI